jgi:hypothetical protein
MRSPGAAPVVLLLVSAGCAAGVDSGRHAIERDSAGIIIVENSGPWPEWLVADTPDLRIGVREGDPQLQLFRVRFAARLRDGRVVVVDGGSAQVRWYGSAGDYRSSAGRQGEGPGEFRDPRSGILAPGDTLILHDSRNRRLTWLSPAETNAREEPLPGSGDVQLLGVLGEGGLAFTRTQQTFHFGTNQTYTWTRDSVAIGVWSPAGADTLVRLAAGEHAQWLRFTNGVPTHTMQMPLPFAHVTASGATRESIVLARSEAGQLEFLDRAGNLRRIARAGAPPLPVTGADRDRYVEFSVESARRRSSPNLSEVSTDARDRLAILPEGHVMPPFDRVLVDSEDRIWVRDWVPVWAPPVPRAWTVYGPDGRVRARAVMPAGLDPMHIDGSHVTGVTRDEMDVEYVTVHRIQR